MLEQAFFKPEHVRRAFLYQEYLTASFAPSCGVHVYDVRIKAFENCAYCFCRCNVIADNDIVDSKCLEVVLCSLAERLLHLVVKYFSCFL